MAPPIPAQHVGLRVHEVVIRSPGVWQCKTCLATARTPASLLKLVAGTSNYAKCEPTEQQKLQARNDVVLQRALPYRSEAVNVALGLAQELSPPEDPVVPGPSGAQQPCADDTVELDGHRILSNLGAMVCTLCGSYQLNAGRAGHSKLGGCCLGPSQHPPTLYKQRHAIKAIKAGKNPKNGQPFQTL